MFVVGKRTTVLEASHIPHKLLVSYDQFIFPTLVVIYSLHWFHSVSVQGLLVFKLVINFFPSMEYNACFDKLITTSRSFTTFFLQLSTHVWCIPHILLLHLKGLYSGQFLHFIGFIVVHRKVKHVVALLNIWGHLYVFRSPNICSWNVAMWFQLILQCQTQEHGLIPAFVFLLGKLDPVYLNPSLV